MYEIGPFQYSFKSSSKKICCDKRIAINKNEFILITGPSGSGKSTLLQMLKGIIPQFSSGRLDGHVLYNKLPLIGPHFENNLKEILFLFQNPFSQLIYPWAKEEFFFSMENFMFTPEEMEKKRLSLNEQFELHDVWEKKTSELSTGQCQRLVLASLLAIEPEVLLLDEPTAFLDPEAREFFYDWLQKIKGSRTVVIVDHHVDEILPLVDKIIQVNDEGRVYEVERVYKPMPKPMPIPELGLKIKEVKMSVEQLNFHYEKNKPLLKDISFSAKSGEIIVIKGKNGQGKSTLFKLMASIVKPISGRVEMFINQKNIPLKEQQKEIGFIFQNPESHFFYDTIAEELNLKNSDHSLLRFYDLFFLGVDTNRSPFLLSEGEKRRLSILMTVFHDKGVLFYDEPTFGQDADSISAIRGIILLLQKLGKIQFIISHDERFIKSLKAREFELKNGHLLELENG